MSGLSGAASSCGGSTAGASEPMINVDELSDEQILTLVNETAIAVEKLHMETVMFDKFYEKLGGGETVTGSTGRERSESLNSTYLNLAKLYSTLLNLTHHCST